MKNTPTIREIFPTFKWKSFQLSLSITFINFLIIFSMMYEKYTYNINSLLEDLTVRSEIILFCIFLTILIIWNYLVSIIGIYLLISSYFLSKRYVRLLIVLIGVIFFLTFFHLLPTTEIDKTYGLINEILIRILQGYVMISMCIFFYGLLQCLVLYVIGRDVDK